MILTRLSPVREDRPLAEIVDELTARECGLVPFDAETVAFGQHLSERLFADAEARRFPDLAALAFRLRAGATAELHRHFLGLESERVLRVPRGLAYHVTPANVETMFVHSWWLSALCGNRNLVRVSAGLGEAAAIALRLVGETLSEPAFARLNRATTLVSHPHDEEIGRALSLAADLRIVWGGDATVRTIRAMPLRPDAVEMVFPDRRSLAVAVAAGYLGLDDAGRDGLAERLYRDAYGFDQQACSSPLLLAWVGEGGVAARAAADFWPRLADQVRRRGSGVSIGTALARMTEAARLSLDGEAVRISRFGNEVVVAGGDPARIRDGGAGGGLFQEIVLTSLEDLAGLVDRKVQTIGHFGFDAGELRRLARRLNGRGGDRLVPIGTALDFSHLWDGQDLLVGMTRLVNVVGARQ
jgi:hypothetical protein